MSLMPQTPFQWFVPATTGTGMVPAAGYLVKYYAAGTTTPKAIYTDPDLTTPYPSPSNTAVLDSDGRALIYLGAGGYKMVVCLPDSTPVYEQDNIAGESSFSTGFVDSYADLINVDTTLNKYTYIGGYYAPGDGGEGMFYNNVSSDSADGGYVQTSSFDPTKRWFRIPDENGDVRAASFGYIPANSGDQSLTFAAAENYASTIGANLLIQSGSAATIGSKFFSCVSVTFASNAGLKGTTGTEAFVFGPTIVIAPDQTIFTNYGSVSLSATQVSSPYWFGGSPSLDNTGAFAEWLAAGSGTFILPPGVWLHRYGAYTPPVGANIVYQGTIDLGGSTYILPGANYGTPSKITGALDLDIAQVNANILDAITVIAEIVTANTSVTGGQVYSQGGVYADGIVQAGANVESIAGAVIAGTSVNAGTYVQAKAGTSTRNFKASGSGNVVVGAGDATLEANALTLTNDYIKIICAGTITTQNPVFFVTVSGVTVLSIPSLRLYTSAITNAYSLEVFVFRTGVGTFFAKGTAVIGSATSSSSDLIVTSSADTRSGSIDWTSSGVVSHAQTAGGTTTKHLTMYEIYPAS